MPNYRLPAITGAALLSQVAMAHALTVNWSWTADIIFSGPYPVGTIVDGTITGLVDNTSGQTNVDITVNDPGGVETGWTYSSGAGFNVSGGVVTSGDATFVSGGDTLFFDDVFPEFIRTSVNPSFDIASEGSGIAYSTVPEPASFALLGAGLIGLAAQRRRPR